MVEKGRVKSNSWRIDPRTSASRAHICYLCGELKNHTKLMKTYFSITARNPCRIAKDRGLLKDSHDAQMEMYHKCIKPVQAEDVENLFTESPLLDRADFTKATDEEFEKNGASKNTGVTAQYLSKRVQQYCAEPAGKSKVSMETAEKIRKWLTTWRTRRL